MDVHHVAFRSKNLPRLIRFYRDVLGFRVVRTNKLERNKIRSVWLEMGAALLMLEAADTDEPEIPKGSNEFLGFRARSKAAVAKLKKRLGRRVEAETEFTIYFRDPDGRKIGVSTYVWTP
jgi:catechol 2,3-dioxygenase-like lactoylglutathione lyase family enzyme